MCFSLIFHIFTLFLAISARPNFVIILTDDQDVTLGGLKPMKNTLELIAKEGATFENAFTTTPLCCPSRASFLTGLYQHNHRVVNNSLEGNCCSSEWQRDFEDKTFAAYMKDIGYSTFYSGKYLNQYGHTSAGGTQHVPQGWSTWIGLVGNSVYYNYSLSVDGKKQHVEGKYLTNLIKEHALGFLSDFNTSNSFLMVLSPPAPHSPFTPEPKYKGSFAGEKVPREPHFNYAKTDDKHWFMRMKPLPLPDEVIQDIDGKFAQRWETLLSVDDIVAAVIGQLKAMKQLENTYIFYTSDNGFHLGQFGMPWDKRQMYEFDIRVPLLVRGPGIKKNSSVTNPTLLMDVAPTILNLAGVNSVKMDGRPFLPITNKKTNDDVIRTFLIEYQGENSMKVNQECPNLDLGVSNCLKETDCKCQDATNNTYSCLRSFGTLSDTIYCQFSDNEKFEEAYDLLNDPYQLKNCVSNLTEHQKLRLNLELNYLKLCTFSDCHRINLDNSPSIQLMHQD